MFKINLEEVLTKENERKIRRSPEELLILENYDQHAGLTHNDSLERIGINEQLKAGEKLKNEIQSNKEKLENELSKFNRKKVFHISQIERMCKKYFLRFLPSEFYKGELDKILPEKITTFETAYNVNMSKENSFIVAPKKNFQLQPRPRDPLLFYKINEEYFYLVHKWGNDLNILRRIFVILFVNPIAAITFNSWINRILLLFGPSVLSISLGTLINRMPEIRGFGIYFIMILSCLSILPSTFISVCAFGPGGRTLSPKENWRNDSNNFFYSGVEITKPNSKTS